MNTKKQLSNQFDSQDYHVLFQRYYQSLLNQEQYLKLLQQGHQTESIRQQLPAHLPVVKLHLQGKCCAWLLSEIDPCNPQLAFGLSDNGLGAPQLGYINLPELLATRSAEGFKITNDLYFQASKTLEEYASEAKIYRKIIA